MPQTLRRYLPPLRRIFVAGRALAYREAGTGPSLLLLHGISSGSESWQLQFSEFAQHFRVIAWDNPGYGGSDALAQNEANNADYAAAVIDLLNDLKIEATHVLGHSLGGLIAAAFARYHPERILSLILSCPATGFANEDAATRAAKLRARLQLLEQDNSEEYARQRVKLLLTESASREGFEIVHSVMSKLNPDGVRRAAQMASRSDIFADVPWIVARTLVICASLDRVVPPETAKRIARGIGGALWSELAKVGHACYVEAPTSFNDGVLRFLRSES